MGLALLLIGFSLTLAADNPALPHINPSINPTRMRILVMGLLFMLLALMVALWK